MKSEQFHENFNYDNFSFLKNYFVPILTTLFKYVLKFKRKGERKKKNDS